MAKLQRQGESELTFFEQKLNANNSNWKLKKTQYFTTIYEKNVQILF